MSNEYRRIEVITGDVLRRRWTTEQKLRIVEESFEPGETVSSAARRHGVAPNLLYRRRRLLSKGGTAAVDPDESCRRQSEVKKLEERVCDQWSPKKPRSLRHQDPGRPHAIAHDLAPKFYPVLSSLQRLWVAASAAVAAGCRADAQHRNPLQTGQGVARGDRRVGAEG